MNIFLIVLAIIIVVLIIRFFELKFYKARLMKEHEAYKEEIEKLKEQLQNRIVSLDEMVKKLTFSNKELARINDLKSKFVSIVAHDLKQPLASIHGYANFLQENIKGEEDQKMLEVIVRSANNMNELMNDLIDASLLSSEQIRLHMKDFDYSELILEVYNQYKIVADQKHIEFNEPASLGPIRINADKIRIGQVLGNLLGNAIKFTPEGGKIEIKYEIIDKKLKTTIQDSGIGIASEEQEKIFEKFHQVMEDDPEQRKIGWGLGLPISYDIIRAHGGEIGVVSEGTGKGSAFWFCLSLVQ